MSIYAISDLHLSFSNPKPMDVFGDHWKDHHIKIIYNWDKYISDDDTVLLCGDHSWAIDIYDAAEDIDFICQRPGKKILIRGNHDYWWRRASTNKIQKQICSSITLLQGRYVVVDNIAIAGTRGWRLGEYDDREDSSDTHKIFNRELSYLEKALQDIPSNVDKKIVMLHYPPFNDDLQFNEFDELIRAYKADIVVYGHLHSGRYINGKVNGVTYLLTSADFLDFMPVLVVP